MISLADHRYGTAAQTAHALGPDRAVPQVAETVAVASQVLQPNEISDSQGLTRLFAGAVSLAVFPAILVSRFQRLGSGR